MKSAQTILTCEQVNQLYELLDDIQIDDSVKKRARIVLLREYNGYSQTQVQKRIATNPKQIRKWVERFYAEGTVGVYDRTRSGRPTTITHKEQAIIEKVLRHSPGESKIDAPVRTWSLASLSTYLHEDYSIICSRGHLGRLLHQWGWVYRKVEDDFVRRDPDYEVKAARVQKLIENPPPRCRVISVDEKGPISVRFHRGRQWQRKEERVAIPKNANKTHGKTVLFGAWDVHSREFWSVFSPKRDTVGFLALLDTLVMERIDSGFDAVYILLDNLSVHKAKKVNAWKRDHPKFKFVFLHTYSSQLQPIEGLFSVLQREVLDNYWWSSVDEIHQAITTWKYFYNSDRRTIHSRLPHRPRASRVLYTPHPP